jgi:8-oxo-dGTP pyrophosphatase MutT (NUDIX family)
MDEHLRGRVQSGVLDSSPIDPFTGITGVGTLFLSLKTNRVLLQFRNSDKRQKHTWGFWGGIIEAGESPYEALIREVQEELGIVPDINKLNPIDVYQSKDRNFMYYSFVAVIEDEFLPTLNSESCGYAWVNIGNWPKPLHEGARATLLYNKGKDKLQTILELHKQNVGYNRL